VGFPLFGHMLLVSGTVSAPSSIFQNLCVSFPFLRPRLGWPFFPYLVLLIPFVGTLPDLNDLFLLEGRSTSFITISYSDFISFGAWLSSASLGEAEGGKAEVRRGGGEARRRGARGRGEARGGGTSGKTKGARRVAKLGAQRENTGWRTGNKRRRACERKRQKGTPTSKVGERPLYVNHILRMPFAFFLGRGFKLAKCSQNRLQIINIYACHSAFFPGRAFKF
jgi:hypothetical protein